MWRGRLAMAKPAERISAEQLREKLLRARAKGGANAAGGDRSPLAVVDVRDDDFAGGHIVGALHVPKDQFKHSVNEYVDKLKDTDEVVFHCTLSQVRGPYCAQLFLNALRSRASEVPSPPQVKVLDGGFQGFVTKFFGDQAKLFADLDPNMWGPDAPNFFD